MRKTLLASVLLVVGGVAMSSASCGGSGSGGNDGGNGSAGTSGKGGTAGKGGSAGSGGTTGSGGSTGAGGSAGSGGACTGEDASAAGLGLPGACETCVGKSCCGDFQTCFADPGCKAIIDCVVSCYRKGGTLAACAETTCPSTSDSSASQGEANKLEFCLVDNCGAPGVCEAAAKDGGGEGGGD